ncbi:MAG: shikimate kinase [Acidimicrobiia bacterium]|nr:shikimate kinase [Acidimicrobiia bacterium]
MGHVWLVGMMGVGKTTVAALVAETMRRPVADTDAIVMEEAGVTIPQLFERGESVFREMESSVIARLATEPDCVIATGGGAVLDDDNVTCMRASGAVVLLEAELDTLVERIAGGVGRPLAADSQAIRDIARDRHLRYREVADHVISTSDRDPLDVATEVVECVTT